MNEKQGEKLRSKTKHGEDPEVVRGRAEGGVKHDIDESAFMTTLPGARSATHEQAAGTGASSSRFPGEMMKVSFIL